MARVFIALGSNLGQRAENLQKAIAAVGQLTGTKIIKTSRNYETYPVGKTDQPKFINAAILIETGLKPLPLLKNLQKIEKAMGRKSKGDGGPRIIDLDILTYDQKILNKPDLQIPHPLMLERRFVLEPLAEIAPEAEHPVIRKTYRELLARIMPDHANNC